ncbi:hypothetical protein C6Q22_06895 [Burkholderia multivorans]|uniref:Uncharacterized protein n=1 Tax=Burkholderia multivorans TaxID=87883 RepID=A0A8E2UPS2_9BURK|nr:hypothetical protein WK22_05695 [Burkholderia multivorans]PRD85447.1 hypothetical protein C6P76_17325 [Burkholderia multivorans]PRF19197.1 hypothetical protein C6P98_24510 [Burkholderia multivorans]PRF37844.1 hypothetical protein C6Q08_02990 [Burkholderia multivorans]PRF92094.1 hypothetical protein C6Q22_06895 [Burkholderia multivorans]
MSGSRRTCIGRERAREGRSARCRASAASRRVAAARLPLAPDRDACPSIRLSIENDRESRQPIDTSDAKSVGGRADSGRVDPAC